MRRLCLNVWVCCVIQQIVFGLTYQDFWKTPEGHSPDFTDVYHQGGPIDLAWRQNLNDSWDDLWITSFDWEVLPYALLIVIDVPISDNGLYTWNVSVDQDVLSQTPKFVFRFKPKNEPREQYDPDSSELSSPGVLIINGHQDCHHSDHGSKHPHDPGDSKKTQKPHEPQSPSDKLSSRAKAGVGLGASVVVLAIIGTLIYVYFKRRRRKGYNKPLTENYPLEMSQAATPSIGFHTPTIMSPLSALTPEHRTTFSIDRTPYSPVELGLHREPQELE